MKEVEIVYTNWKNVRATRTIQPIEIWFGKTNYHPEDQWLLKAFDREKGEERDFAMKDIEGWSQANIDPIVQNSQ
jgi:predicted DNA-binding transcriptional regulator YafY